MLQTPTVMVPIDWKIEMPVLGDQDERFGGCASIEGRYTKVKQIGEGTYGQVGTQVQLQASKNAALGLLHMLGASCMQATCGCLQTERQARCKLCCRYTWQRTTRRASMLL